MQGVQVAQLLIPSPSGKLFFTLVHFFKVNPKLLEFTVYLKFHHLWQTRHFNANDFNDTGESASELK